MVTRIGSCVALILAVHVQMIGVAHSQPAPDSTTPSELQIISGKELYRSKGSCLVCHGWAGDGHGDPHSAGNAANLRRTRLSRTELMQVISCGRPGTSMPHFNPYAYTEDPCYGMKAPEAAAAIPPASPRSLQPREIVAVIDYLIAKIIGKGAPTRQECIEFFSEAGPCANY
jgi:mono/diheme cytochrome c family protein